MPLRTPVRFTPAVLLLFCLVIGCGDPAIPSDLADAAPEALADLAVTVKAEGDTLNPRSVFYSDGRDGTYYDALAGPHSFSQSNRKATGSGLAADRAVGFAGLDARRLF